MNRKHNDESFSALAFRRGEITDSDSVTQTEFVRSCKNPTVLLIEPYYGGSHKQLMDILLKNIPSYTFVHLKAKKWHWRARCGALILSNLIPAITTESVLFCSSVLNLAELVGLRPDLNSLNKIVYFHENQLVYPIRCIKDRDIQYAYNQITTCIAADLILFNSKFNKESFLNNIEHILKMLPDYKPKGLREQLEPKCKVMYFPVDFPRTLSSHYGDVLHIVWPHRWEFDKGPASFMKVLFKLKENGRSFRVSILGEVFEDVPDIFHQAREVLNDEILHFGYLPNKEEYYRVLSSCHVAVSTAAHEFFGVSMLEAVYCGCYPLVPNRLAYPEIYPASCLYETEDMLYKMLQQFCLKPEQAVRDRHQLNINFNKYRLENVLPSYLELFGL